MCNSNTVSPLSIQTKAFYSTGLRRETEHREKIRMQRLDGEYDIMSRSYVSVKFAKCLNTKR